MQEIKVTHGNGTTICMACLDQVKWGCPWMKYGTELCKAILEMPKVKRISGLECKGVSGVEPKLFVSLLNRQEKLFVYTMNPEKLELLFIAMAEETNVKKLFMIDVEFLYMISPELFAAAISNVAEVNFDDTGATSQQMMALYSAIINNERPLRKLKMDIRLIGSIDPDIVVSGLNRLEEVTVLTSCYGHFTVVYVHAIIKPLVDGESKLKRLMLKELDPVVVRQLDKELVKRAIEKI